MKTQGFTLIELLAVIVILAIIALIATPIVLGIIDDAKESAQLRSAEMYLKGVANAVMKENLEQEGNFKPTECSITSEGNLDCDDKEGILEVEVDGEKPKNGTITFTEGKIKEVTLNYTNSTIVKNEEGNLVFRDEEEILVPGLYDAEGNMTKSWEQLIAEGHLVVEDGALRGGIECDKCEIGWSQGSPIYGSCGGYHSNLEGKLVVDSSVSSIAKGAFGCQPYMCGHYREEKLTEIVLPNTITTIGEHAFAGAKFSSINIPNSVTSIGSMAFSSCTNLMFVTIPNSVTSIGSMAFEWCEGLIIKVPNTVIIGNNAFLNCKEVIYY